MPGDEHIREGGQPHEHVVLDDLERAVIREQLGLLLVNIERQPADAAALDGGDMVSASIRAPGCLRLPPAYRLTSS